MVHNGDGKTKGVEFSTAGLRSIIVLQRKRSLSVRRFINASHMFVVFSKPIIRAILLQKFYPSQTKILEVRTNLSECVFEALFKGVSTRFGRRIVEKCFENAFGKVGSDFQNLRLGSINFRRSSMHHACLLCFVSPSLQCFYKEDYDPQTKILDGWTAPCVCVFEVLFKGAHCLKIRSKPHTPSVVRPSKLLRLGSIQLKEHVKRTLMHASRMFVVLCEPAVGN